MSEDMTAFAVGAVMGLFLGAMIGGSGIFLSRGTVNAAIDHGCGHYVMDPKTGNTQFHWNDEKEEAK